MTRVHVLGAAGYAGSELVRLLTRHPNAELVTIESASAAGEPVGRIFPELRRIARKFDGGGSVAAAVQSDDVIFCAAAHGVAREAAPGLLAAGARVIDLSADFRLDSASGAVYGLPERYRVQIERARLIANPGCYPTATLLALAPLGLFAPHVRAIAVDAKSGVSGAGRTPITSSLFGEIDGDVRAYGLEGHRHLDEIIHELRALMIDAPVTFTPQVVPLQRGMLVAAYVFMDEALSERAIHAAYLRAYDGNPFVRISDEAPSLRAVAHTNDAELHVSVAGAVVRILVAIDNLGKGAAGQAVQNFNIMCGYAEGCGLDDRAVAA